ncbi:phage shock protein C (PspC) family protein [Reichenbachiella faecimaris]|uniref:Phage shock protein C (PspC) family protein n=1 Tax=Reichenbachiella faecimaris TaxID=692418 RepID=A0A1W2G6R5_REIFA|nr:PspC domain-containing protein [Reichenbachiella faecimaris]SMD32204.1 phage shock protein C (PspC) family protein [Reichenbachiella faecimaris]
MKKNISINISGIIFHIEEDGYAQLKAYLETINNYFSNYEDSAEIIADIESRVAEIFLSKLDDGKQIINHDDVKGLIDTMGTVADFEALEDDEPAVAKEEPTPEQKKEKKKEEQRTHDAADPGKQKLHRDEKRKVIGGVAAGIAYYFSIDPLWIRLIAVLLFLNIFVSFLSGSVLIAYIILWIVIPGSNTLGDDEEVKKMFRDPDNQVLGGVSSGIAAYFAADVTLIRLLFVLSIFLGGTGLIIYIILWMITPVAKSLTDKMQMQGEPVTLSNIEHNVKKSLRHEEGEESSLAKVLLFPFRLIAALFTALAGLLGPFSKVLINVIRIFAGIVVTMVGVSGMVSLFVTAGILLGLFTGFGDWISGTFLPVGIVAESVSGFTFLAVFLTAFIPFLVLCLLGISIMTKNMVLRAPLGWSIFGVWVLCLISLSIAIPSVVGEFRNEGTYRETRTFDLKSDEPILLTLDYVDFSGIDATSLKLRGHKDSVVRLDMRYEAHGRSRQQAEENAQMISYDIRQKGNELIFDSDYSFKARSKFRAQQLDMTLYIPYNRKFVMDEDMVDIIEHTFNRNGYRSWQITSSNEWVFTEAGLDCLTCSERHNSRGLLDRGDRSNARPKAKDKVKYKSKSYEGEPMTFDIQDFDELEVGGIYNVYLTQGDEYSIEVKGRERYKRDVLIKKYGNVLEIDMTGRKWDLLKDLDDDLRLDVFITMPGLERINSKGLSYFEIKDFEVDDLDIDLGGASSAEMNLDAKELKIYLNGASSLELEGLSDYLEVDVSGASTLKAYEHQTKTAEVSASGASNAKINASKRLTVDANGLSTVRYKGDADVNVINEDELSTVRKSGR